MNANPLSYLKTQLHCKFFNLTINHSTYPHLETSSNEPRLYASILWTHTSLPSLKVCLHVRFFKSVSVILLIVIRIIDRVGQSPVLAIIHTITIGTMLNFNDGNNVQWLNNVALDRMVRIQWGFYTFLEIGYSSSTALTGPCTNPRTSGSSPHTSVKCQSSGIPRVPTYYK